MKRYSYKTRHKMLVLTFLSVQKKKGDIFCLIEKRGNNLMICFTNNLLFGDQVKTLLLRVLLAGVFK